MTRFHAHRPNRRRETIVFAIEAASFLAVLVLTVVVLPLFVR